MKQIALVLSGGGAKGAFQAGALQYIDDHIKTRFPDFSFTIISGVSVGCLNGVMVAMNRQDRLLQVWNTIENSAVYTGKLNLPSALLHLALRSKQAILGRKPLLKLVEQLVSRQAVLDTGKKFMMGVVSLTDGDYHRLTAEDFADEINFQKAVLASGIMPVLWEPMPRIRSRRGSITQVVDGGLRNNSPLGDVLDLDPDEVVIINCSPFHQDKTMITPDADAARNVFSIAQRSLLEIALNEIFVTDLREYLNLNHLVLQAREKGLVLTNRKGKALKAYKTVLISPLETLGDMLDFSQPSVQKRLQLGFDAAREAFKEYEAASGT
ncbi:MAG: patatin-like phospholipase family protein, partial [Bacteroidetes bacterium]|nr:patatin-like phospholipase family protein [Bacteroidota bacterium]